MAAKNSTAAPKKRAAKAVKQGEAAAAAPAATIPIMDDDRHTELQDLFIAAGDVLRSIQTVAPLMDGHQRGSFDQGTVAPEAVAAMAGRVEIYIRSMQRLLSDAGVINQGRDDAIAVARRRDEDGRAEA